MNSGQIGRQLHNRTSPKQTATATESTQATTSGPYPGRWQSMNGGLTELDDQLQQVKVFAEEQIIQVIINFSLYPHSIAWLTNPLLL